MDKNMKQNKQRGFLRTKDNTQIFYEFFRNENNNETIVLINGIFQCAFHWYPITKLLLNRFNVLIYDLRGQGKTKTYDCNITMEKHISDLYELVSYFDLTKFYIAGISFGSYIAVDFAKKYFNYIKKLFLLSFDTGYKRKMILENWISILSKLDKTMFIDLVVPIIFSNNFLEKHKSKIPKIKYQMCYRLQKKQILKLLNIALDAHIGLDVTHFPNINYIIINGAEDPLISISNVKKIKKISPYCEKIITLPRTGHSLIEEVPHIVAKNIIIIR